MKVAFFGSPKEAVPALRILHAEGFEISAVYTRPDRPAGRSVTPQPTPVRVAAEEMGLEVRTPASLRGSAAIDDLRRIGADALVVVAYGRILPPDALAVARLGAVNIHPSLLPRYRGPSPVSAAIRDGASETGVTLMLLDKGMDTGPILLQEQVSLDGAERCGELTSRLFEIGARLLPQTLRDLASGAITPVPQDESQASVTSLLSRDDGRLDWTRPAEELERLVRAYDPWPGTHTTWNGKTLKVLDAGLSSEMLRPSQVEAKEGHTLVGCGRGALQLHRLQLEGRRAVDSREFLNGNPSFAGARLPS